MTGEPNFTAVGENAVVTTESIVTALNGGTSVSVNTGSSGLDAGNITIKSNIAKTAGGAATLRLSAASDIVVDSNVQITSTSDKLHIDFNADSDGQYGGTIQLKSGSRIVTNGGNIDLYGGKTGSTSGYAGSVDASLAGLSLQGGVTLNTAAASGTGGNINLRGSNSGNNIMTTDSGKFLGISIYGSGNTLQSGGGNISLTALGHGYYAGQEALTITDATAQISAGAGTVTLTADSMTLAGHIGGLTGDTGRVTIAPLTPTVNIAIGDGAVAAASASETVEATAARGGAAAGILTALKLSSAVFGSVIQPGLTVVVGASDSSGAINLNNVLFRNDITLRTPGTSASPVMRGVISITGPVDATGYDVTLNSYQGASVTAGAGIIADGLELLDPRNAAVYDFSLGSSQVGVLAANTGQLLYTGSGATTVGTVGGTDGITLHGAAANTVTPSQSGNMITLAGAGADLTVNKSIAVTNSGAVLALSAADDLTVNAAAVSTNAGALSFAAVDFITTGTVTITAGSAPLSFTADAMSFSNDAGSGRTTVSGTGELLLQPFSADRPLYVGGGSGGDTALNLSGSLFSTGHRYLAAILA